MNSKYRLNHYRIKEDSLGVKHYMVYVQKEWIEVSSEVFHILDSSVRNEQLYEEKKKKYRVCSFEELQPEVLESIYDSGFTPEQSLLMKERNTKMENACKKIPVIVSKLKAEDSDLIMALFYKGETISEYARRNGVSVQNLHYQRKRILQRLRKMLTREMPGFIGGDLYA